MFATKLLSKAYLKVIILFLALVLTFSHLSYANKACVLSDQDLDGISAGGLNIEINSIGGNASGIASQNNIAAMVSFGSGIFNSSIFNTNFVQVSNIGNSAIANQSNISLAIVAQGDINGVNLTNTNSAYVNNQSTGTIAGGINLSQLKLNDGDVNLDLGTATASNSAVVSQANIAGLVSLKGNITNSSINNFNYAEVNNVGNSALVAQNNISLVLAPQGTIDAFTLANINNTNTALVQNTVNGAIGQASISSMTFHTQAMDIVINAVSSFESATIVQNNISIIASLNTNNINISNLNNATVIIHNN